MIDQLAGIVQCDPEPLTMRRLVWRAEARQRDQWNHTAPVLSMLEACRQQSIAFDPTKFHPLAAKDKLQGRASNAADRKAFNEALRAGERVRRG